MRRSGFFRRMRGRPNRTFVSPSQRDEEAVTTAEQMIRQWSVRSTRLCLADPQPGGTERVGGASGPAPGVPGGGPATAASASASASAFGRPDPVGARSLTAEVAHLHPGTSLESYTKNLRDLYEGEVLCDVTLVAGSTTVRAHRCVLAARFPPLLAALSASPGADVVDLSGTALARRPDQLRGVVGRCYGVQPSGGTDDSTAEATAGATGAGGPPEISPPPSAVARDLEKLSDLRDDDEDGELLRAAPPDVFIIGCSGGTVEWTVEAHTAVLCAQSEYARSLFAHGWAEGGEGDTETGGGDGDDRDGDAGGGRTLRLDAAQFAEDTVRELVLACYSCNLYVCNEPIDSILQLLDAAAYLGMDSASLLCEEALGTRITPTNLPEMLRYGAQAGARLLPLECHKFLCRNLDVLGEAGTLGRVDTEQMRGMLSSNFVESPEEDILRALLLWSEARSDDVSEEELAELVALVRIPVIPVDSPSLVRAVERGWVNQEQMRVCRLFQTDGDFRSAMLGSGESMCRFRMGRMQQAQVQSRLDQLEFEEMREAMWDRDFGYAVCRMLGTVNGRNNFQKISSIKLNDGRDGLLCDFPEPKQTPRLAEFHHNFSISFSFTDLPTPHMPSSDKRQPKLVDRSVLQSMSLQEAEGLTANMLRRGEELRLHPRVQSAFGLIGENEAEMSRFTTALQAHVVSEFNVDPAVGVELIRSASVLFPETANIAHYVRHNRCFRGRLRVDDDAPDVAMSTLGGDPTTMWAEIDKRRSISGTGSGDDVDGTAIKPVVILGASYT